MLHKVYVIDDDEISLYLTRAVFELSTLQTECICFESAQQALSCLKQAVLKDELPKLVLLDLNMPFINGLDFLEALKPLASALDNKCFICVLTSSLDEQDRLQSLASGLVLDLIQKPFPKEKLEEVNKLLSRITLSLN